MSVTKSTPSLKPSSLNATDLERVWMKDITAALGIQPTYKEVKEACERRGVVTRGANLSKLIQALKIRIDEESVEQKKQAEAAYLAELYKGKERQPFGPLNRDVWRVVMHVMPVLQLYKVMRLNKQFKALAGEVLAVRMPGSGVLWRSLQISADTTPKAGASIELVGFKFKAQDPWCLTASWLHDWGTLFEDWSSGVDVRTGKSLPGGGVSAERRHEAKDAKGVTYRLAGRGVEVIPPGQQQAACVWRASGSALALSPAGVLAIASALPNGPYGTPRYKVLLFLT